MIGRHLGAAVVAIGVTFGLFYLMQALISKAGGALDEETGGLIEFVRLKKDTELELKKRKMPEKQKLEEPPPPPDLNLSPSSRPDQIVGEMAFNVDIGIEIDTGPSMGGIASDTDIVPIVRVNPQYPLRAQERGISGWVELEFSISAAGTVKDAIVTASHPGSIFNRAALRAIQKWKYNPKVEDGEAVERPGVTVRLTFDMTDS